MRSLRRSLVRGAAACALLVGILCQSAGAQAYRTESGHAEFHSTVPLHTFTGTSDQLHGRISLADSTVDFYLDLNTLETGVEKRDKDMRETLETEQYPFAEFYGSLDPPFDPVSDGPQEVTARGEFTIHGITREIAVEGTLERTGEGLRLTAAWTLDMTDHEIKPPGILFYRVSEQIEIEIEATLTPENR